jgi:hypothetical protein
MHEHAKIEVSKGPARFVAAVAAVLFTLLTSNASAKPGIIVKGENGTRWCCVEEQKGLTCEKGASSIPVGANCNFASRAAPGTPIGGIVVKGGKNK